MNIENINLTIKGINTSFSNSDTKETVKEKLGEPDNVGGHFGKRKIPLIYKYEEIEFHFDTDRTLFLIYKDDENTANLIVPLQKTL